MLPAFVGCSPILVQTDHFNIPNWAFPSLTHQPKKDNGVCGVVSVVMILVVAALLLFLPLGMGPVQPPSAFTLLIFPLVLLVVFILLSRASST
ncbi:hypothetical protein TorRG33x02_139530 [Trema orientale]|uniref:Transmembrane protein n=1 Tax=Trema orientale TaxID=63057 RepID=A0A2P5EXP0_TREOI|nr:hypothetical protein TorRG33x02_139530 [Trema orientale]